MKKLYAWHYIILLEIRWNYLNAFFVTISIKDNNEAKETIFIFENKSKPIEEKKERERERERERENDIESIVWQFDDGRSIGKVPKIWREREREKERERERDRERDRERERDV